MKIIVDEKIPFIKGVFESLGMTVVYAPGHLFPRDEVKDADALVVRTRTHCDAALLSGSTVKFIATATIGFDHIDSAYCAEHHIAWKNAPGCNAVSVQQYIADALCYFATKFDWDLREKTLGIIGCGNTGTRVHEFASAIGMKTFVYDPPRLRNEPQNKDFFTGLDTVLKNADIVTCHVPRIRDGVDCTEKMVDARFLERMKPQACLINASRGEVVDEPALLNALASQKLSGAILDVWCHEPAISPELMRAVDLSTPHIAGYAYDGKFKGTQMAVRAVYDFFKLTQPFPSIQTPPPPEFPRIDCAKFSVSDFQTRLSHIVNHTYSIEKDSARLRANPENFEALRNQYPLRREFSAYTLCNIPEKESGMYARLGFQIEGAH